MADIPFCPFMLAHPVFECYDDKKYTREVAMKSLALFVAIFIIIFPALCPAQVQVRDPNYVPNAMKDYIICPGCGQLIAPSLAVCPHCSKILFYRRLIITPELGITHYTAPPNHFGIAEERQLLSFGASMTSFRRLLLVNSQINMGYFRGEGDTGGSFFVLKGKYELGLLLNRGKAQFYLGPGLYVSLNWISGYDTSTGSVTETWSRMYIYPALGVKIALPRYASFATLFANYFLGGFSFGGGEEKQAFFGNTLDVGGMAYVELSKHWGLSLRGELLSDFSGRSDPLGGNETKIDYVLLGGPSLHF